MKIIGWRNDYAPGNGAIGIIFASRQEAESAGGSDKLGPPVKTEYEVPDHDVQRWADDGGPAHD